MKRNLFIVAAVTLMAMISCNKDNIDNGGSQEPSYYVEFTANVLDEEPQLKTLYRETDRKTLWEADDAISVNGKKFQVKELYDEGLSAKFKNVDELGEFSTPYVAVSPYQDGHVVSGTTVSGVVLKAEQTATAASFESNAVVAMAYNADNNVLAFKNVCSIVKFKLGTASVKKVTITSNNGENLAGTLTIDYNNGEPKVTSVSNGTSTITLSGSFNTTDTYYVAVLASGLENGITVCLDGTVAKTVANELAFKRSIVMNAGTLSLSLTSPGDDQKVYLKGGWNDWGEGTPMYFEGGLFVARNVPMSGEFKVHSDDWYGGSAKTGAWFSVSSSGSNMKLSSYSGNYDVYFSQDNKALYIAKSGDAAPSIWYVYGSISSSSWKDIAMYPMGEYFVAKNVNVTYASAKFLFRTLGGVNNYYLTGSNLKPATSTVYATAANGNNTNISVATGIYDIYMTGNAAYFFVVPAGHSLNDSDIKLNSLDLWAQNSSNWSAVPLYVGGDYFVAKDVTINSAFLLREGGNSWTDKWGLGTYAGLNKKSTLKNNGTDIKTINGTVSIYINHDLTNFWVMESGRKPAN